MSQARQAVPLAAWYEARAQARARRRRNRVLRRWAFALVLAIGAYLVLAYSPAEARERYTAEDTLAAIGQYSEEFGVPEAELYSIVRCETGGTFDPYSVGGQGELGAAQLHPRGELRRFLSWGYNDPFSPYQAVRFLAQEITFGRARAWSCA